MAKTKRASQSTAAVARRAEQRARTAKANLATASANLRLKVIKTHSTALSTYSAAEKNRLTSDWKAPTKTANEAYINDSSTIINRARQARRDSWVVASIAGAYRRSIVGTGITPISSARDLETGEPLKEFNLSIDALWTRWARNPWLCDIEGHKSFTEIQATAAEELAVVGEAFAARIVVDDPDSGVVPLRVQLFEPEHLDMSRTRGGDNTVTGGIEHDKHGCPLAYWLVGDQRVAANVVQHVFTQERAKQIRGVSPLASVLVKIRHLGMYDEYMLIAARLEACIGAAIQTDPSITDSDIGLPLESGASATDSTGNTEIRMEPGMMTRLAPGESMNWNNPTRPGTLYDPFVRHQVGQIAAGVGLGYEVVARDYTKGSYSAQRQGMLESYKETDRLQLLLIDSFCRPIREEFKTFAVMAGLVEAPGFFTDPVMRAMYLQDEWQGPAKPWIDPQKQARAMELVIKNRLTDRESIMNEQGRNIDAVFPKIGDEKKLAAANGFTLPEDEGDAPPAQAPPLIPNAEGNAAKLDMGVLYEALLKGNGTGRMARETYDSIKGQIDNLDAAYRDELLKQSTN